MLPKNAVGVAFTNLRGELYELIEAWGGEWATLEARKRQMRRTTGAAREFLEVALTGPWEENAPGRKSDDTNGPGGPAGEGPL